MKSRIANFGLESKESASLLKAQQSPPKKKLREWTPSNQKEDRKSKLVSRWQPSKSPLVYESKEMELAVTKQDQFRKGSKLAAKFSHIQFDPSKLRAGAIPPSRKRARTSPNIMMQQEHVIMRNVSLPKRRRRSSKTLVLEVDSEDNSGPFTSLFQ